MDAQETGGKCDMIIGSDIMEEQGIEILYSHHCIVRDDVHVPLKLQGELLDVRYYERLFNMHRLSHPSIDGRASRSYT